MVIIYKKIESFPSSDQKDNEKLQKYLVNVKSEWKLLKSNIKKWSIILKEYLMSFDIIEKE